MRRRGARLVAIYWSVKLHWDFSLRETEMGLSRDPRPERAVLLMILFMEAAVGTTWSAETAKEGVTGTRGRVLEEQWAGGAQREESGITGASKVGKWSSGLISAVRKRQGVFSKDIGFSSVLAVGRSWTFRFNE